MSFLSRLFSKPKYRIGFSTAHGQWQLEKRDTTYIFTKWWDRIGLYPTRNEAYVAMETDRLTTKEVFY